MFPILWALFLKKQLILSDPITSLNGIGPRSQEQLNNIGINKIQDLLFHLPYRYIDRTRLIPLGELKAGADAYLQGEIELTQVRYGRRRSLLCRISDGTGAIILRFFYFLLHPNKKTMFYAASFFCVVVFFLFLIRLS